MIHAENYETSSTFRLLRLLFSGHGVHVYRAMK